MPEGIGQFNCDENYFKKVAIAFAWSSVTPATAFVCGALVNPPLVTTSTMLALPLMAGALLPSPAAPWHIAHLVLYIAAPSSANAAVDIIIIAKAARAIVKRFMETNSL